MAARVCGFLIGVLPLLLSFNFANGRLTELFTERLPILAHNLQDANIDLRVLNQRALLGPGSSFKFKTGEFVQTAKGGMRARLIQTYGEYEVYGPTAVAELNMEGHFTGHMYGDVARNLHLDIPNPEACKKNVKALINRAIRLEKLHPNDPNIDKKDGRRVIYANPKTRMARIVYVVEFFYSGHNVMSFPIYYMDACSNSVILSYDKVKNFTIPQNYHEPRTNKQSPNSDSLKFIKEHRDPIDSACDPSAVGEGGNPKSGKVVYNTHPLCLPVTKSGPTCTMDGTFAKVIDNENSEVKTKTTIITFPCDTGYSDPVNEAYGVANDAAYFGQKSGEFFKLKYGVTALEKKPRMVVHFGKEVDNAYWTGDSMFFGDGKTFFYPLTVLDVTAHELAHGFTNSQSGLIYMGMSGGIDEAFSDITGVATTYYTTNVLRWTIGEAAMKREGALRYLNDPPKDGKSIKNAWRFRPLMNVHYSSGVFNHAFYQMVDNYKMDIYKAYECFMKANMNLWGKFTWFRKGACNVLQACNDLGYDSGAVKNGFKKTWLFLLFCRANALKTTLFPGETRRNILVSKDRSPMLEIDNTHWRGTSVKAVAEDLSVVGIMAATDIDAVNVIARGNNYLEFPGNYTKIYIKLKSHHQSDVKVTLDVFN